MRRLERPVCRNVLATFLPVRRNVLARCLLLIAMVLAAAAAAGAQVVVRPGPPPPPGSRGSGPGLPGRPGIDAIVERILEFDADDDQKVTKDELNERLQDLVVKGDANGDEALDISEIRRLAANAVGPQRRAFLPPPPLSAQRFVIRPPAPRGVEGIVNDLKLEPAKREEVLASIRPLVGGVPTPPTEAVALQVLARVQPILDHEAFEDFKAALDRLRLPLGPRVPGVAAR